MTFGWLLSSVFIWKLIPTLTWIQGLAIAACVTATDPVLASAVVGKGKFAKRVPGHLRNILSAESGCNDGMAFPFAYLALNIIKHTGHPREIAFDFIVITVLYECVFGCVLGAIIGYVGRHAIKFAEKKNLIDRESFLVFYFVLALFCTGVGSIIGVDDLLVAFAAGTAFSWDGWFARKTEESHVSNVIDLLLNMAYFVYLGAIVPWQNFNNKDLGIEAWKLVILAILILLFRRLPIVLAMKPFTPDIRTWREALFCGHFGPIGVGAIFISILVRAELEHGEPTPLAEVPPEGTPNYFAIAAIWPVTTFLVICSIVVHGSSIAVFTLGKRLNNMTITMSYTTGGNNQSWLSRLPRIEGGRTLSLHKVDTDEPGRFKYGKTAKPAGGMKRRKGGRKSRREPPENLPIDLGAGKDISNEAARDPREATAEEKINQDEINAYAEGHDIIIEDNLGEVIATVHSKKGSTESSASTHSEKTARDESKVNTDPAIAEKKSSSRHNDGTRVSDEEDSEDDGADEEGEDAEEEQEPLEHDTRRSRRRADEHPSRRSSESSPGPRQMLSRRSTSRGSGRAGHKVIAYQLDNDVIVENEDGEIIRRYRINRKPTDLAAEDSRPRSRQNSIIGRTLSKVGLSKLVHSNAESSTAHSGSGLHHQHSPSADHDVEKQEVSDIVPVEANHGGEKFPFDDDTIRHHLKSLLHTGDLQEHHSTGDSSRRPNRLESSEHRHRGQEDERSPSPNSVLPNSSLNQGSMPRNFLGRRADIDENDEDDEVDDHHRHKISSSRHADDDEETEVERKRRLAALGLLSTEDDEEDEEERNVFRPRQTRLSPAPEIIREEDEEDDVKDKDDARVESEKSMGENTTPKIQWGDDVKRGHGRR
ncbi:Nha1p [Sugiyamaella lignohabitans]|uniref:Nha1p n=1 Tax=Sugiyamaella lignohabitans TaxID=796027 RepID=A0A167FFZ9_9ASCO|nr:Nha1p [Sugiyamaella lignohabitans]ANB15251.1 Nha1p [Sugiyamaella lignohabitans]